VLNIPRIPRMSEFGAGGNCEFVVRSVYHDMHTCTPAWCHEAAKYWSSGHFNHLVGTRPVESAIG